MKALHFGAGNIGRGFIGLLLAKAGIAVTFADVDETVVAALKMDKQYSVDVVGEQSFTETVTGVDAVNSATGDIPALVAEVDLITTAVGPNVLKILAPSLAKGIALRQQQGNNRPLNIIACENMVRGTSQLKEWVLPELAPAVLAFVDEHVGFVDSAVDRIVPPTQADPSDPLRVTVETFSEWIVDKTQFCGEIPDIDGMQLTDNLLAFVQRKLFTLNTGHATTAYLARLQGYQTIDQAINDPSIEQQVRGTMEESGAVLIKRFGFDPGQHAKYIDKLIDRFRNPHLHDDVERVGRQPLRKLGPEDRLIMPLQGTLEYDLPHSHLVRAVAAACCYQNPADEQAVELQTAIGEQGIAGALSRYTGLAEQSPVMQAIAAQYQQLAAG